MTGKSGTFANASVPITKDDIFRDASPFVRKCAAKVVAAAAGREILDVACGSGRNAIILARLGATVVCIDKNLTSFDANLQRRRSIPTNYATRLLARKLDLLNDPWPFAPGSVGGIINVHFLMTTLLSAFAVSLTPGAYLLLETVPGHGANYLELPRAGELKELLEPAFELVIYEERRVGPSEQEAVAAKVLAWRKA